LDTLRSSEQIKVLDSLVANAPFPILRSAAVACNWLTSGAQDFLFIGTCGLLCRHIQQAAQAESHLAYW
jgi:hypothetical protein